MIEADKEYKLKCKVCDHEFVEYFNVYGYAYTGGTCCPKCGSHIDIRVSENGELTQKQSCMECELLSNKFTEELITIGIIQLEVKKFRGQRVVTLKDIDLVHGRAEGTARKFFNKNKNKLINGKDYFIQDFHEEKDEFGEVVPLTLITEQGYIALVNLMRQSFIMVG